MRRILFDKDDSGGQSTDDGGKPTDPGGRLHHERLIAKYGDAKAALQQLAIKLDQVEADNAGYRKEIKELKEKVPADGAVVLEGDDAKLYQELVSGDTDLKSVAKELEEGRKASSKLQTIEHQKAVTEVAQKAGLNAEVLADISDGNPVRIEGEGDSAAVVIEIDGKATPVEDIVEDRPSYVKESLFKPKGRGDEDDSEVEPTRKTITTTSTKRRPYVVQTASGGPSKKVRDAGEIAKEKRRDGVYGGI